jgi:mRNA interferase MazF
LVARDWAPDAGDIIWLNFDPQAGHEQAGHRPALVLSPVRYNRLTGMAIIVPMTTRVRGNRFEVAIGPGRDGVALSDQVKSLDWRARKATRKGKASAEELEAVRQRVRVLVG